MTDKNSFKSTKNNPIFGNSNMDQCNYAFKTLATIICLICFFANNFIILKQFISGKTIIASNFKAEEPLFLPAILICNFSAYKEIEVPTIDLDHYFNNTFRLSTALGSITLVDIEGQGNNDEAVLYNKTYRSENIKIESIYTYFRGHCYKFQFKKKVITFLYCLVIYQYHLYKPLFDYIKSLFSKLIFVSNKNKMEMFHLNILGQGTRPN